MTKRTYASSRTVPRRYVKLRGCGSYARFVRVSPYEVAYESAYEDIRQKVIKGLANFFEQESKKTEKPESEGN